VTREGLDIRAQVLLATVCASAAGILVWAGSGIHTTTGGWAAFAILGSAAAVAQLFPVMTPRHNAFTMSVVFTLPGIFLLPLPLVALLPIVQLLPEWLKERYPWYMVAFNASNWTLNLYAGWAVLHGIEGAVGGRFGLALATLAAVVTVSVTNHFTVALMITSTQKHTLRSTGMLSFESLSNEAMLDLLGVAVAMFWLWNPWLIPVARGPPRHVKP
jgi:hypothetical protein